jgi:hypothetical protein
VRAVRGPARRSLTLVALLACALLAGACGGSDDDGGGERERVELPADFNLQLYKCADWQRANGATRRYVIRRLREVTSGQVSGTGVRGRGTILPDEQAHRLFDEYCAQRPARGFVLYKVYGQAAGFAGGAP